ncbi:hypothetical protein DSUL_90074 [Desulfovibrionales bacterium]
MALVNRSSDDFGVVYSGSLATVYFRCRSRIAGVGLLDYHAFWWSWNSSS